MYNPEQLAVMDDVMTLIDATCEWKHLHPDGWSEARYRAAFASAYEKIRARRRVPFPGFTPDEDAAVCFTLWYYCRDAATDAARDGTSADELAQEAASTARQMASASLFVRIATEQP